jgi:hypothetical protein
MNKEQYIQVLHGLLKVLCWRQLDMWTASALMLLHDSTSTHYSNLDQQDLVKCGTAVLLYPPSSPNIALSNLFLFDWLKPMLFGHINKRNSAAVMRVLHLLIGDGFQHCFYSFCAQWQRHIRADRNPFLGVFLACKCCSQIIIHMCNPGIFRLCTSSKWHMVLRSLN